MNWLSSSTVENVIAPCAGAAFSLLVFLWVVYMVQGDEIRCELEELDGQKRFAARQAEIDSEFKGRPTAVEPSARILW